MSLHQQKSCKTFILITCDFVCMYCQVLSVGSLRPANVSYSYVLPIEGKISFQWSVNDSWTRCSSECGGNFIYEM